MAPRASPARGATGAGRMTTQTASASLTRSSPAEDEVHRGRADELGDEQVARPLVELLRRRDLLEEAVPHHRDAIAHRHRLGLVVRDVDRRDAEVALDTRDLGAHLHPQLRVEVRERLVHEERLRVADDRPPIATRCRWPPESVRGFLCSESVSPRMRAASPHAASISSCGRPRILSGKPMFFAAFMCGIERVVLEHHRDVAVLRRQVVDDLAVDHHLPGRDRLEAGDHPERRRLPAARGPDEHDELAAPHVEVEVGDGLRAVGVDLRQALERDLGHVRLRARNLLGSSGSHGGARCAVETGR